MGAFPGMFPVVYNLLRARNHPPPSFPRVARERNHCRRVCPSMTHKPCNVPAPDDLLLTAREALKTVLREPDGDHGYTILMAMNAMGITARAMQAASPAPVRADMTDDAFARWVRQADDSEVLDAELIAGLRRHIEQKLAVSNPRFKPESPKDDS